MFLLCDWTVLGKDYIRCDIFSMASLLFGSISTLSSFGIAWDRLRRMPRLFNSTPKIYSLGTLIVWMLSLSTIALPLYGHFHAADGRYEDSDDTLCFFKKWMLHSSVGHSLYFFIASVIFPTTGMLVWLKTSNQLELVAGSIKLRRYMTLLSLSPRALQSMICICYLYSCKWRYQYSGKETSFLGIMLCGEQSILCLGGEHPDYEKAEQKEQRLLNEYKAKLKIDSDIIPDPFSLTTGWKGEKVGIEIWPSVYIGYCSCTVGMLGTCNHIARLLFEWNMPLKRV